jgi:hypothetical protein
MSAAPSVPGPTSPLADGLGAPSANGAIGASATAAQPSESAANGAEAPLPNDANGRSATVAAPSGNGANGADARSPNGPNGRDAHGHFTKGNAGPGAYRTEPPSLNGAPIAKGDNGGTVERAAGRGPRGRFAPGNVGGPGNPFIRRVAALRRALLEVVSEQDVQDVAVQLVLLSRAGDVAAMKLLLAYAIGKPTEAVDPDSLDLKEWQLYRQSLARPEVFD